MALTIINYRVLINTYTTAQTISTDCNSVTFLNNGSNALNVDGIILEQGQQFSITGNLGEYTDQVFNVSFINSGGTNSFTVTRKIYN